MAEPDVATPERPRLLLVGAGHAHLHLLDRAAELSPHYDVTLVAPRWFHYSGTASAVATGDLPPEAGRVDVAALARRRDVRHVVGRVVDLDPDALSARTEDGTTLAFDLVSLNIGSTLDPALLRPGLPDTVVPTKPLPGLSTLRDTHERRVSVVGGGASGLELAAHAAATGARVTLLAAQMGADLPPGAARRLREVLDDRRVEVRAGVEAVDVAADVTTLADGTRVPHDVVVLATGLVASPDVARWGLGDARGVPVTETLSHPEHPHVLAAGDCAHFLPSPLPRVGVHGVRQAPVLLAGLIARAEGRRPPAYEPQRPWLLVLDLGERRGLAVRGRWWWEGRSALWLKRRIDRRWLERYSCEPVAVSSG